MIINNTEIEFDLYDTENLRKIELGEEKCRSIVSKTTDDKDLKVYEKAEIITQAIIDMFDELLGEEVTNKIFKKKTNFMLATKIYAQFIDQATKQTEEIGKELDQFDLGRLQK